MSKKVPHCTTPKACEMQRNAKSSVHAHFAPSKSPQMASMLGKDLIGNFPRGNRSDMESLFDKLKKLDKGENVDVIRTRGIEQLCNELCIKPNSFDMLTLMWRLRAIRANCVSRDEWLSFIFNSAIFLLPQLKTNLNDSVRAVREQKEEFYSMYNFLYDYIRGESNRRMPVEKAIQAWKVFFSDKENLLDDWSQWVLMEYKNDISRDMWAQTAIFFCESKVDGQPNLTSDNFSNRSSVIEDFCRWKISNK